MEARWQSKKDMTSPLLRKTPKSQLTAEQSLTGKHWNLPKTKRYPKIKDKEEAPVRWEEGRN